MSNFTTIKAAIVSICGTLSTAQHVYDYANESPDGYPSIDVTSTELDGEFADTQRNRRGFSYSLLCRQERTVVGSREAERLINAMVDEIVATFDSATNLNLQNQAIFYEPVSVRFGYLQSPDIDVRTAEVIIKATVVQ